MFVAIRDRTRESNITGARCGAVITETLRRSTPVRAVRGKPLHEQYHSIVHAADCGSRVRRADGRFSLTLTGAAFSAWCSKPSIGTARSTLRHAHTTGDHRRRTRSINRVHAPSDARGPRIMRDQSNPATPGEICPKPVEQGGEAIPHTNHEANVYHSPQPPCWGA